MQQSFRKNIVRALSIILTAIAIVVASVKSNAAPHRSSNSGETFDYTEIAQALIVPQKNGLFENQNGEQILIVEKQNPEWVGDSRFFYRPKGSSQFYQLNIVRDEKTATLVNYSEDGKISTETLSFIRAQSINREISVIEIKAENGELVRFNLIDDRNAAMLLQDPSLKYLRLPTGFRDLHFAYETKLTKIPLKIIGRRFSKPSYENLMLIFGRNRTQEMKFTSAVGSPGQYSELSTANNQYTISTRKSGLTIGVADARFSIRGFDPTPEPLVQLDDKNFSEDQLGQAFRFFNAIYPKVGCGTLLK